MEGRLFIPIWLLCSLSVAFVMGCVWLMLGDITDLWRADPTLPERWVVIYLLLGIAILPGSALAGYFIAKLERRLR